MQTVWSGLGHLQNHSYNVHAKSRKEIAEEQSSSAAGEAVGGLIGTLGSAYISKMF